MAALAFALVLGGAAHAGQAGVISVDFTGSSVTSMSVTESAGVIARTNWNRAGGISSSISTVRDENGNTVNGALIQWSATGGNEMFLQDALGNVRMMNGYLDAIDTSETTINVTLNAAYASGGYAVFVYCDSDNPTESVRGIYTLTAGATLTNTLTDAASSNFSGTFIQGSGGSLGNFVVFSGLNAQTFALTAKGDPTDAAGEKRGPVNGIQIVPTSALAGTPLISVSLVDNTISELGSTPGAASQFGDASEILLTRSGGNLNQPFTLNFVLSGSATPGGQPGADYAPVTTVVTFGPGVTTSTIVILPLNDATQEGPESVTLTVPRDPSYILGNSNTATVLIRDDDFEVPTQNLLWWLKSSSIAAGGGKLNQWANSAPNAAVAFAAQGVAVNQPTFVPSGPNNRPTVRFAGNDTVSEFLSLSNGLDPLALSNYTIMAAAARGTNKTFNYFIGTNNAVPNGSQNETLAFGWRDSNPNTVGLYQYNNDTELVLASLFNSNMTVLTGSLDTAFGQRVVSTEGPTNTFEHARATSQPLITSYSGTVGRSVSGPGGGINGNFNGDLSELLVYNGILPEAVRVNLELFLLSRYRAGVAPIASNDFARALEDGAVVNFDLLANDQALGNTPLVVTAGNAGQSTFGGSVVVNANLTVAYRAAANFSGTDTFTYTVRDASGQQSQATVTVNVVSTNDPPVIPQIAAQQGFENTGANIIINGVTAGGGSDETAQTLIMTATPSRPTLFKSLSVTYSAAANIATVSYVPATNQTGSSSILIQADDGQAVANTATMTFTLNIAQQNDAPTFVNPGPLALTEDTPTDGSPGSFTITGINPGVAGTGGANDPVVEADEAGQLVTLSATSTPSGLFQTVSVTQPNNGSATVSYKLALNRNGPGVITITATDNGAPAKQSRTDIIVNVAAVNDEPVMATPNTQAGIEDTPNQRITLTGIGPGGGVDEASQRPTISIVCTNDPGLFSSLTVAPVSGSTCVITYTPALNKSGSFNIQATADDAQAVNNTKVVNFTLAITNRPDAPVAVDDVFNARVDTPLVASAPGVMANDDDPDGDLLTASLITTASSGSLNFNSDGSFTYVPLSGFTGDDAFTYRISDGSTSSSNVTATIHVGPNIGPVADDSAVATDEDTPITGFLAAHDDNLDPLTYRILTNGTKGTLVLNDASTGAFTYTPLPDVTGSDFITFRVNDGVVDSPPGSLTVNINPINDPPSALNANIGTGQDVATVITLNASDIDGDTLAFTILTQPLNGTLSGVTLLTNTTAQVTYTPNAGYIGSDSFDFLVNDGTVDSAPAVISLAVSAPPVWVSQPSLSTTTLDVGATLTGTGIATAAGTPIQIQWNFGDGTNATGNSVNHAYAAQGQYTVTATAASSPTLVLTKSFLVTVSAEGGGDIYAGKPKVAKITLSYVSKAKTSFAVSVNGLNLQSAGSQAELQSLPGTLVIGAGRPGAQTFTFTLDSKGKAKATGLPAMQLSVTKGTLKFTVNGREALTDLLVSLGASSQAGGKFSGPIDLPVTLLIGNKVVLAFTFHMQYQQKGSTGKAALRPNF